MFNSVHILRHTLLFASLVGIVLLSACSTYKDRVAPVPLPALQANHVEVGGVLISANAYVDDDQAEAALGFDARAAGLIPVRFVIDNQSQNKVRVVPGQTFLIDQQGQAWPVLSAHQAYERVKQQVQIGETFEGAITPSILAGAAGAVAGFAIGILSGGNIAKIMGKGAAVGAGIGAVAGSAKRFSELDEELRTDLYRKSLQNRPVRPAELAYGYLFFPGFADESISAGALRLSIRPDPSATPRVVNLLLNQAQ